ncbi:MAG: hypothetical protein MJ231_03705 [bacterium]|nr:hypothetical protein [bacterium]
MKRNLLLAVITVLFAVPTMASITVEEMTEPEAIINSGYSQAFAEDVFVTKNRATSKPVEPLYEKSQNKFVKACKFIYAYIDPAQDEYDRIHHDVKLSPDKSDL